MKMSLRIGTAVAVCLLAVPAIADTTNGYGVSTAARARNAYSLDSAISAFRTTADSSGNYTRPGDVPSFQVHGCNYDPAQLVTCVGGASGTGGTNFNLTASNSNASLMDDVGSPVRGAMDAIGTGVARSDLATGQLGVAAVSNIWRDYRLAPTWVGANAFAQMNDTLTFNVAGANAATVTNIGVDFVLNGSLGIVDLRGGASVSSQLYFGSANTLFAANIGAGSAIVAERHSEGGWVSGSWVIQPAGAFHFTGVYALSGISDIIGFAEYLYADAGGSGSAVYDSTSHFTLTLPSNVSFTSASGTFLSALSPPPPPPPSAVPEPASWAMMIAGFAVLGGGLRRRPTRSANLA